jgi:hypothetical protein
VRVQTINNTVLICSCIVCDSHVKTDVSVLQSYTDVCLGMITGKRNRMCLKDLLF